ncbi:MAG: TIGR02300 family protein [Beijerinckiaceae bacterium]
MARPELGTKRVCPTSGRKFYDLGRDPILSPYSGESWPRSSFEPLTKGPIIVSNNDDEDEDEAVDPVAAAAEFVPIEVAEGDAGKDVVADDIEIDEEIVVSDDDDTFLAVEEEGDDDVADLIDSEIEGEEEV